MYMLYVCKQLYCVIVHVHVYCTYSPRAQWSCEELTYVKDASGITYILSCTALQVHVCVKWHNACREAAVTREAMHVYSSD